MPKAKSKADAFPWCTRIHAAQLIQLSPRRFDEAIRPRLPVEGCKGKAAKLRYNAPIVVATFVAYRIEQEVPPADLDDPLMGGPNSPQLERYRKVNADLKERQLAEVDKKLVRREVLMAALNPALAAMRGAAERLAITCGNAAVEIYNEAVGEFIAALEQVFGATAATTQPPSPVAA